MDEALPNPLLAGRRHLSVNIPQFFRRIVHYAQMDLEYTFWQMVYLCIQPKKVCRTTTFHKQTKNQWARDDPAFIVILVFFLAVTAVAFAIAFQVPSFFSFLRLILGAIFFDFVGVGVVVATFGWWFSNRYLRVQGAAHHVDQKVEWAYAFDIHCNSFFPMFLLLHVLQYFLLPVLLSPNYVAVVLGNTLYAFAFMYYHYISFLGYSLLPFLENTEYFYYPIFAVAVAYMFFTLSGVSCCRFVLSFYFAQ